MYLRKKDIRILLLIEGTTWIYIWSNFHRLKNNNVFYADITFKCCFGSR